MSQPHNLTPAVKISNASTIVTNAEKRRSFLYSYDGFLGLGYYMVKGIRLSEKEVDILYPVMPKPIRRKGYNPDTTKIE
jgi:hypothetical protein